MIVMLYVFLSPLNFWFLEIKWSIRNELKNRKSNIKDSIKKNSKNRKKIKKRNTPPFSFFHFFILLKLYEIIFLKVASSYTWHLKPYTRYFCWALLFFTWQWQWYHVGPIGGYSNTLTQSPAEEFDLYYQRGNVRGMTLKCIWWWSYSSEDPWNEEDPFIAIKLKSFLIRR